jgi:hypothetical protein
MSRDTTGAWLYVGYNQLHIWCISIGHNPRRSVTCVRPCISWLQLLVFIILCIFNCHIISITHRFVLLTPQSRVLLDVSKKSCMDSDWLHRIKYRRHNTNSITRMQVIRIDFHAEAMQFPSELMPASFHSTTLIRTLENKECQWKMSVEMQRKIISYLRPPLFYPLCTSTIFMPLPPPPLFLRANVFQSYILLTVQFRLPSCHLQQECGRYMCQWKQRQNGIAYAQHKSYTVPYYMRIYIYT